MELIGAMLLPDSSRDCVPAMYSQFLQQLDDPIVYSWGSAVLACLYRNLCRASMADSTSISGPLMLLQMWVWTHFPMGRPQCLLPHDLGGPDADRRHAFGIKWCGPKRYINQSWGKLDNYRKQIEELRDCEIAWTPYDEVLSDEVDVLAPRAKEESHLWFVRIHMIHFWMIECHYPDRVMRQLGRAQSVPPPAPEPWEDVRRLHRYEHDRLDYHKKPQWVNTFADFLIEWEKIDEHLIDFSHLYDDGIYPEYIRWFLDHGKTSVHARQRILDGLHADLPGPEDPVASMRYPPRHEVNPRMVERKLSMVAYATKLIVTKASKKIGKFMLSMCRADLKDVGQVHRMHRLLETHDLPIDIDTRPDSGDEDDLMPDPPTVEDQHDWFHSYMDSAYSGVDVPDDHGDVLFGDITQCQASQSTATPDAPSTVRRQRERRAVRKGRAVPAERFTPS